MTHSSRIPHSLRGAIFLLRIAIGFNLFYFNNLSSWLPASAEGRIQPIAQWALIVIGVCLVIGLAVRYATVLGAVVVLFGLLPGLNNSFSSIASFVSGGAILIICLLILFLANAGTYIGLDRFIHLSFRRKHAEQ